MGLPLSGRGLTRNFDHKHALAWLLLSGSAPILLDNPLFSVSLLALFVPFPEGVDNARFPGSSEEVSLRNFQPVAQSLVYSFLGFPQWCRGGPSFLLPLGTFASTLVRSPSPLPFVFFI